MADLANTTMTRDAWDSVPVFEQENYGKWPVWVRILVIVGLSVLLWAGIISGVSTLLSLAVA